MEETSKNQFQTNESERQISFTRKNEVYIVKFRVCAELGHIPNYIRTTTNSYKGLITEKVASNYLRKKGFLCSNFSSLSVIIQEFRREKLDLKTYEEQKIKNLEDELRRDLEVYSSKSPPKKVKHYPMSEYYWDFKHSEEKWEDFRKKQLEIASDRREHLHKKLEEELSLLRSYYEYFRPIENYRKWLKKYGHYVPDYIAKKKDEVFIIEVKSQNKGKTAFFGEHQKRSLLKAHEFGFVPMLIEIPIDINIEIGEAKLRVGKEVEEI